MTMTEFEKWLVTYITGVYHQREHRGLMTSPIQQYEKGVLGTDELPGRGLPRRIVDEDRLRLNLMPFVERTVQPYGVVVDEVHYYSDVLRRFVNAKGPRDGKTMIINLFKRLHPADDNPEGETIHLPVLIVQAPPTPSEVGSTTTLWRRWPVPSDITTRLVGSSFRSSLFCAELVCAC